MKIKMSEILLFHKKWVSLVLFLVVTGAVFFGKNLYVNILGTQAAPLTSASITLSSYAAGATGVTATVSFTSPTVFSTNEYIKVTFDSDFTLTSVGAGNGACSAPAGLTFSTSKAEASNTILMLRNDGGAQVAADTAYICTIANVANPAGAQTTTDSTITTTRMLGTIDENTTTVSGFSITSSPTLSSQKYLDNNNNGAVDQIELTFSATIATCTATVADFTLVANDITGAALAGGSVACTGSNAVVTITLGTAGNTNITSHTIAPTIAYTDHADRAIADGSSNQVATFTTQNLSDGAGPVVTALSMKDASSNDGKIDRVDLTFSEALSDTAAAANGFDITSVANHGTCNTESANPDGTTTLILTFTCSSVYSSIGDLNVVFTTNSGIKDAANNQAPTKTFTSASIPSSITDSASPILTAIALSSSSNRNRLTFTYSEAITVTNGASTNAKGDVTSAGTVVGFGTFATTGNVTVPTTLNTVGGSASTTITLDLADQAAAYMNSASTTEPSGVFTPSASAQVVDAASNQVNTSNAPTATGGGTWDVTKPTITSVTISDSVGNNGKVDRAVIVFNSSIRDANITNGDGTLGAGAGAFSTGTANDATTTFNLTSDTLTTDTSATAAQFNYSAATTKIIDLAGNLVDTATDGQIADADVVETDGASPIIKTLSYEDSDSDGKIDRFTVTFTETVTAASVLRPNDLTLTNVGDFTGATFGSDTTDAITGSVSSTIITLGTESSAIDTAEGSGNIAISTQNGFSLTDGTNTNITLGAQTQATFADGAKPQIKTFTYLDNNADGKIDRFTVTFTETVTAASVLRPADLNITAAGDFTAAAFGADTTDSITGSVSSATIVLGTASTAEDTNEGSSTLAISSQNNFSLTDGTNINATLGAQSQASFVDGAAPIVSALSLSDADSNGKMDLVTLTYTENLTDTASAANGFDVTSAANHGACTSEAADPSVSTSLSLSFSCATAFATVGDLNAVFTANAGIVDSAGNQSPTKTFTSASTPAITTTGALSATITPASLAAGTTGNAVVAFTTVTALPATGKIVMILPTNFSSATTTVSSLTGIDGTFAIAITNSNKTITLTRQNDGTQVNAATAVQLTINAITNPTVSGTTGTFTLRTTNSGNTTLDQNSLVAAVTIIPATITTGGVSASSLTSSVSGVTYTFTFTTINSLPLNGKIKLTFPSGFTVSGASGGTCASSMDGTFATAASGQIATLTRSGGTATAAGAQSCNVSGISNTATSEATLSFSIQTSDSSDALIDQKTTGLTVTIAAAASGGGGGGGGGYYAPTTTTVVTTPKKETIPVVDVKPAAPEITSLTKEIAEKTEEVKKIEELEIRLTKELILQDVQVENLKKSVVKKVEQYAAKVENVEKKIQVVEKKLIRYDTQKEENKIAELEALLKTSKKRSEKKKIEQQIDKLEDKIDSKEKKSRQIGKEIKKLEKEKTKTLKEIDKIIKPSSLKAGTMKKKK